MTAFEHEAIAQAVNVNGATQRNTLAQSDREDELTDWLEAHQVEDGWRIAAALVEAGLNVAQLEKVAAEIGGAGFGDVLARVAAQLSVAKMTSEIKTSVTRISELVGAIKEYSYMDQGAVQKVDIIKGL